MVALLREIGLLDASAIPINDVEAHLKAHPELIKSWLTHSQDQRCSAAWYLAEPGAGLDGNKDWRVGYFSLKDRQPELAFADEFAACAFFIARYIEHLAQAG